MISRSLGPEFGGAIGIMFTIANSIAVSMYIIGFCDSLNDMLNEYIEGFEGIIGAPIGDFINRFLPIFLSDLFQDFPFFRFLPIFLLSSLGIPYQVCGFQDTVAIVSNTRSFDGTCNHSPARCWSTSFSLCLHTLRF